MIRDSYFNVYQGVTMHRNYKLIANYKHVKESLPKNDIMKAIKK